MSEAYETTPRDRWQGPPSDALVAFAAAGTVLGVWCGWRPGLVAIVALGWSTARLLHPARGLAAAVAVLVCLGGLSSSRAWHDAAPRHLGGFAGWAWLRSDPAPLGAGTSVLLELDGERFRAVGARCLTMEARS